MCIVCLAFLFYLKRTSYPVRASFGELEFTSCEINHLHIGAKPIKRKNVWNSIQIANKRKTKMCAHTPIMWAHLFAYTIHPVMALPCPTPGTVPGVMWVLNKYWWMNDFGSTESKEAWGKKKVLNMKLFFSPNGPFGTWQEVTLNQGKFYLPGDDWQYLGTFLFTTAGKVLLAPLGEKPGELLNILRNTGQPPSLKQKITLSKMSVVLKLRNPGIRVGSTKPRKKKF